MMIAYDGTFDGLLTCLYHLVRFDGEPVTIQRESYLRQTLYEYRTIATSRKKADLCLKAIRNISPAMTAYLYKAWLSEQENIETDILHFLRLAAALRKNPESQLFRSFVANVMSAAKRCGGEAHRFLGLIRFKQVGENAFLADMRPECHILPIICPHFAARFGARDVLIRDQGRGLAGVIHRGKWQIAALSEDQLGPVEATDGFEALWKQYFQTIAIKARENPRLQRQYVPNKYREYLVEMD